MSWALTPPGACRPGKATVRPVSRPRARETLADTLEYGRRPRAMPGAHGQALLRASDEEAGTRRLANQTVQWASSLGSKGWLSQVTGTAEIRHQDIEDLGPGQP